MKRAWWIIGISLLAAAAQATPVALQSMTLGQGPTIVVIHNLGGSRTMWRANSEGGPAQPHGFKAREPGGCAEEADAAVCLVRETHVRNLRPTRWKGSRVFG